MTVGLVSGGGYFRRTAVVAMAMFLQYWYWFPMAYLLPLAFKTTALIGVTAELRLPRFEVTCACQKGTFAYAKPVTDNSKKKARRFPAVPFVLCGGAHRVDSGSWFGGFGGNYRDGEVHMQATKLPTAVLSTTKKAKDRAKRKAEAKAAGGSSGATNGAAAAGGDGAAGEGGDAKADGAAQGENGAPAAEASAPDKSDDTKCPFAMENPCRRAPAASVPTL